MARQLFTYPHPDPFEAEWRDEQERRDAEQRDDNEPDTAAAYVAAMQAAAAARQRAVGRSSCRTL